MPRSQRGIVFLPEAEDRFRFRFRFRFRSSVPPPRRAPAAAAGRSREAMSPMRSRAQLSLGRAIVGEMRGFRVERSSPAPFTRAVRNAPPSGRAGEFRYVLVRRSSCPLGSRSPPLTRVREPYGEDRCSIRAADGAGGV